MVEEVRTDDGLRAALVDLPTSGGWDGPLGRRVLAECSCAAIEARRVVGANMDASDSEYTWHLVGVAWECPATAGKVGDRRSVAVGLPARVMSRAAAIEASARDRLCSSESVRRGAESVAPHTARRIDEAVLDAIAPLAGDPTGDTAATAVEHELFPHRCDPAPVGMVEQLVAEGPDRATDHRGGRSAAGCPPDHDVAISGTHRGLPVT